jgi:hypothetical protein
MDCHVLAIANTWQITFDVLLAQMQGGERPPTGEPLTAAFQDAAAESLNNEN